MVLCEAWPPFPIPIAYRTTGRRTSLRAKNAYGFAARGLSLVSAAEGINTVLSPASREPVCRFLILSQEYENQDDVFAVSITSLFTAIYSALQRTQGTYKALSQYHSFQPQPRPRRPLRPSFCFPPSHKEQQTCASDRRADHSTTRTSWSWALAPS